MFKLLQKNSAGGGGSNCYKNTVREEEACTGRRRHATVSSGRCGAISKRVVGNAHSKRRGYCNGACCEAPACARRRAAGESIVPNNSVTRCAVNENAAAKSMGRKERCGGVVVRHIA
jgi:hypothetical protein